MSKRKKASATSKVAAAGRVDGRAGAPAAPPKRRKDRRAEAREKKNVAPPTAPDATEPSEPITARGETTPEASGPITARGGEAPDDRESADISADVVPREAEGAERPAIVDVEVEVEAPIAGDAPGVNERSRDLEQRLDALVDEASQKPALPPQVRPPPASTRWVAANGNGDGTVFDTAREILSTDFFLRRWGRIGMRDRSEEVDDFGFDPVYEQKVLPLFDFLYRRYFRVECAGVEHIPANGRCLLVANHSGTVPYDGLFLKLAVKREHPQKREVRWLTEDFIQHFPFVGSFVARVGAVRACPENAERLLAKDSLVAVFPEGVKGIGKLFRERYRLQRFGRGGYVKLCLRTKTPIVPVAIIGAEETNPMLGRIELLTKLLGVPYVPITPTFPLLGPLGLLPAPAKWKIVFGEPMALDGHGPEAADDEILIGRLSERVRATIQAMLDKAIGERRSVWFG